MAKEDLKKSAASSKRAARERQWRAIIQEWSRSGLSKAEFCRRRSLSSAALYWWQGELARRDRQGEGKTSSGRGQGQRKKKREPEEIRQLVKEFEQSGLTQKAFAASKGIERTTFGKWVCNERARKGDGQARALVPVRLRSVQERPLGENSAVEIVLARGRVVRVSPGFDDETVARLLAILEETC